MTVFTTAFRQAARRELYNHDAAVDTIEGWYAAALKRLPLPYECITVDTRLGNTHLIKTGNPTGQPIVLLHGLMNNALIWEPQLPALQEFCVYAVDIIGQAGRSYPCRPSLLTDDYAHWLIDVLDQLQLENAAFVGLSMGALLALCLAAYTPDRVSRLALLSPAGLATIKARMLQRIIAANLPGRDSAITMRDLMTYIFMNPDVPISHDTRHIIEFLELIARYQKTMINPRAAFEGLLTGLPVNHTVLARCDMPSTVIVGADDVMFDAVQVVRNAAHYLPNFVGAKIIPDSGHAMIYQQAEQVNVTLVDFLRQ